MSERCETCRFWLPIRPEPGIGQCRRYPPSPPLTRVPDGRVNPKNKELHGTWPEVRDIDLCGEYSARRASDEGGGAGQ